MPKKLFIAWGMVLCVWLMTAHVMAWRTPQLDFPAATTSSSSPVGGSPTGSSNPTGSGGIFSSPSRGWGGASGWGGGK